MEEREPRLEIWSTPRQPNRWHAYFKMLQEQLEDSIQNGFNQEYSTSTVGENSIGDVEIQASLRQRLLGEQLSSRSICEALNEMSDVLNEREQASGWVSYDFGCGWPFKEEKKVPTIIELSPEEEF